MDGARYGEDDDAGTRQSATANEMASYCQCVRSSQEPGETGRERQALDQASTQNLLIFQPILQPRALPPHLASARLSTRSTAFCLISAVSYFATASAPGNAPPVGPFRVSWWRAALGCFVDRYEASCLSTR